MLRRGELLLEGDVGGGEALVVDEEGLDLLELSGEALLDDCGVLVVVRQRRRRGERAAGEVRRRRRRPPFSELVEERGVHGEVRRRRMVMVAAIVGGDRRRGPLHRVRWDPVPPRHGRPKP